MNEALEELSKEHENVKFVKVGWCYLVAGPSSLHAQLVSVPDPNNSVDTGSDLRWVWDRHYAQHGLAMQH